MTERDTGEAAASERSMAVQSDFVHHPSPGTHTLPAGSWLLPAILSITAGAVDIIGFLALGGLFTAHITGNMAIVAAHYISGGFGQVGPLLAVPMFIAVLGVLALAFEAVPTARESSRRALLLLHAALLATCLGLGVTFGPFANADGPLAVLVGMLAVTAMATQSALVKLTLQHAPSTAVMTTNATQLTIDLATLAWKRGTADRLAAARRRAAVTLPCVVGFVGGCATGAVLEVHFGLWALALPVGLAAVAVVLGERRNEGRDDL